MATLKNQVLSLVKRGWLHLLVDASRDSLVDMKKVLDMSQPAWRQ
jgi:hypothetical protein